MGSRPVKQENDAAGRGEMMPSMGGLGAHLRAETANETRGADRPSGVRVEGRPVRLYAKLPPSFYCAK